MDCFLSCPECVIGDSVCDCSNARVGNQIQGYNSHGLGNLFSITFSEVINKHKINSCFYHYKYEVKSLILCNTDEFSEQFPFDLAKLSSFLEMQYTTNDVFHVSMNNCCNEDGCELISE